MQSKRPYSERAENRHNENVFITIDQDQPK
jgi:hypothetical protein